jgi:hypothetical protein
MHEKPADNGKQISWAPAGTAPSGAPRKKKTAQSIEDLSLTRTIVSDAIRRYSPPSGKTTLLVGHYVGLTPDPIDNLVLVGRSTSLAPPTAALFGSRSAVADKRIAGPERGGLPSARHAQFPTASLKAGAGGKSIGS